jgi:colanic acid/amylovoran biosynthesis protein
LLGALGLDPKRPIAACAVSQGIPRYAGVDAGRHRDSWLSCIGRLTTRMGIQVLLVPHVQETNPGNDDVILCTELLRGLPAAARQQTRIAAGDFTAAEYKAMIGRCELVIAERMHAALAGLSSAVATVAIGYSVKARGILMDLLGPQMVDEQGLLVPIEAFVGDSVARSHLEHVHRNRGRITAQLRQRLPRIEAAARENFDLLQAVALGKRSDRQMHA